VQTASSFPPPRRFAKILTQHRVFRDVFELSLVGIAFLLYFLVRGSVVDRTGEAFHRAVRIIDLEQNWGFFWEAELQALIMGSRALVQLFNAIYFWLDFPLIVVVGLWLYFWHRHQYTVTRDAILSSGAIALVIYHLFPVAPPRLLPGFGFVDTLAVFNNLSYQAQSTQPFVNPYAAVPSLHVGWAVLVMVGIIGATRAKPIWFLAALLPVAQFAAIVFTANHFIFDAMVGLVVSLMGLVIAIMLQRFGYAYLRRWLGQEPAVAASARST
jgi:hypothetical protein